MKIPERYGAWKEHKKQIDVSDGFAGRLMTRVRQYQDAKEKGLFDSQQFLEWLSGRFWAKGALAVIAAGLGFVRLLCVIVTILNGVNVHG